MIQYFTITPLSPRLKPRRRRRLERPQQTLVDIASRIRQIEARLAKLEQERDRRHKLKRAAQLAVSRYRHLTAGTTLAAKQKQTK
jgi:hypothetical protein